MAPSKVLRWHDAAVEDLEATHEYLFENSPEGGRLFAQRILEAAERLRIHPELGPLANDLRPRGRYRSWVCGHHRLIYKIEKETVWLLRVWDSRQDPRTLRVKS